MKIHWLQLRSSDMSPQSLSPSQIQLAGIQRPVFAHWNWSSRHATVAITEHDMLLYCDEFQSTIADIAGRRKQTSSRTVRFSAENLAWQKSPTEIQSVDNKQKIIYQLVIYLLDKLIERKSVFRFFSFKFFLCFCATIFKFFINWKLKINSDILEWQWVKLMFFFRWLSSSIFQQSRIYRASLWLSIYFYLY